MAAGDKPYRVSSGIVTWQKETTFGTSPASGAWNAFGYRVGDLRDPGPTNTWSKQRAWSGGREAVKLDLMSQDYGGPLARFKLTDPKILGFAWGQELSAPAALGGGFYRHTATPTTRHPPDSMSIQVHDEDPDGNATRQTTVGGVMNELEVSLGETLEVEYEPTFIFQKEDTAIAKNTVTEPSTATYKHFHGYIEVFDAQLLRVLSANFRKITAAERRRFWNDTNPKYAYEYPLGDEDYILTARTIADGKQFSGFGSRDLTAIARNGDIGKAVLKAIKTTNQDEFQINIGSSNDALSLISAPRTRPAGGGDVIYDLDFACRASTFQWVDTNSSRYFSS